eukprot:12889799-Heterocapsa_arctica.AAC.1
MARGTAGNKYGGDRVEQLRPPPVCETMARCSFGGLEYSNLFIRSRQNYLLGKNECKFEAKHRSRIGNYVRTTDSERRTCECRKKIKMSGIGDHDNSDGCIGYKSIQMHDKTFDK